LILLTRTPDDNVRAFDNVCRASTVKSRRAAEPPQAALVLPLWDYGPGGNLVGVPVRKVPETFRIGETTECRPPSAGFL